MAASATGRCWGPWGLPWGCHGAQGSQENQPPARRQEEHAGNRPAFLRQSEHTPKLVIAGLLPYFRKRKVLPFLSTKTFTTLLNSWNFLDLSCHVSSLASALTKAISGLRYFLRPC